MKYINKTFCTTRVSNLKSTQEKAYRTYRLNTSEIDFHSKLFLQFSRS